MKHGTGGLLNTAAMTDELWVKIYTQNDHKVICVTVGLDVGVSADISVPQSLCAELHRVLISSYNKYIQVISVVLTIQWM